MTSVVIIDDGINEGSYNTGSLKLNIEITPGLDIQERSEYDRYLPSHGTTCAAIIKKYCHDAVIGSIKVLSDTGRAVRDQLVAALLWCADNDTRLVSLSIGTIDFRDCEAVRKAVNYAARKGVIIVSACNNKNIYTYPASLSNVIGVKCDIKNSLKEGQYRFNHYPQDGIDITACAAHSLIKYDGSGKTTPASNSFAAPMITAIAYDILQHYPTISLEEMKYKLAEAAVNPIPDNWHANMHPRIDWVESVLIFDVARSKNINIPYRFNVKNVIDIECTDSGEGLEIVLESLKKNEAVVHGVDTVVVNLAGSGHTVNEAGFSELANTLGSMNKNLAWLDDHWPYNNICRIGSHQSIKIFHPSVYKGMEVGEKAAIDVPVIAVYDFNGIEFLNCIGTLKDIFREDGYNAVAVSDTCRGIAAGIEYMPCMGNVPCEGLESISLEHINRVYNPDIILLGIDASNKDPDYFKEVENKYEIDIKILISNEKNYCVRDMIGLEADSKIILVTAEDEGDGAGIVDISDKSYIQTLYGHIIRLFEENGKLMDVDNR